MEAADIARVFDACFAGPAERAEERARMVRGGDEPIFLPAGVGRPVAEVAYARDLAPSCLHEAAHWLRAGAARRRLVDYGYWYAPDGRDEAQQRAFEQVEVEVQALEAILAEAAGVEFRLSCDNLACAGPSPWFADAVIRAAHRRRGRLSGRMRRFATALTRARSRNDEDRLADGRGGADTDAA